MADKGFKDLWYCATVKNYNPDLDRAATEEEDTKLAEGKDYLPTSGKRSTYKEGNGIGLASF